MVITALDRLPHREPFRFVSDLQELEPQRRGVGEWRVVGDEGFFKGHFPGNPIVPGVLLAEALSQLAGLVAFAGSEEAAAGRLAQVNVKFLSAVIPPASIRLKAVLVKEMSGLYLFEGEASVGGILVANGTLVLARAS